MRFRRVSFPFSALASIVAVVAFLTAMQVVGQALTGVVGDRWSKRGIVVVCMGMHAVAMGTAAVGSLDVGVGMAVVGVGVDMEMEMVLAMEMALAMVMGIEMVMYMGVGVGMGGTSTGRGRVRRRRRRS